MKSTPPKKKKWQNENPQQGGQIEPSPSVSFVHVMDRLSDSKLR